MQNSIATFIITHGGFDYINIWQTDYQTSQELRMLSSVTINCQVTKIVINPGSQLSVL